MTVKKKKEVNVLLWISLPLYALGGYLIGLLAFHQGTPAVFQWPGGILLLWLCLYLASLLQTLIHECGHLVCGLLSGYRFSSFRIGSLMLVSTPDGMQFKRLRVIGTGGQCLLVPPEWKSDGIPFVLYNLGGILANLLSALLCWGLSFFCRDLPFLHLLLLIQVVFGPIMALLNGLPVPGGPVNNDGRNTLDMLRNPDAVRAVWVQLQVSALGIRGIRMRDMPADWFSLPEGADPNNALVSSLAVYAANRTMDELHFDRAEAEIRALLEGGYRMPGIYRNMLRCDLLFCLLLRGADKGELEPLLDKEQRRFLKGMKTSLSVLRTQYALALLQDRDEKAAVSARRAFEKAASRHPSPADIASERELIAQADEAAAGREV